MYGNSTLPTNKADAEAAVSDFIVLLTPGNITGGTDVISNYSKSILSDVQAADSSVTDSSTLASAIENVKQSLITQMKSNQLNGDSVATIVADFSAYLNTSVSTNSLISNVMNKCSVSNAGDVYQRAESANDSNHIIITSVVNKLLGE